MVHIADEPADLVRELGVLFPASARRRLLAALTGIPFSSGDRLVLDEALARDARGGACLELDGALERLDRAVRLAGADRPDPDHRITAVRNVLADVAGGAPLELRSFVRQLDDINCVYDRWDLIVVGSHTIICDVTGKSKLLTSPDAAAWTS
jgi:hypothetical protein